MTTGSPKVKRQGLDDRLISFQFVHGARVALSGNSPCALGHKFFQRSSLDSPRCVPIQTARVVMHVGPDVSGTAPMSHVLE